MTLCPKCRNDSLEEVERETQVRGNPVDTSYQKCSVCGWDNKSMKFKEAIEQDRRDRQFD